VGLAQTNGEVRQVLGSSLFATVEGEKGMGRGVRSDVQGGEVGGISGPGSRPMCAAMVEGSPGDRQQSGAGRRSRGPRGGGGLVGVIAGQPGEEEIGSGPRRIVMFHNYSKISNRLELIRPKDDLQEF
jgi:hypothetical protein